MPETGHGASAHLPRYRCHKEVHALKVAKIEFTQSDGTARITPADHLFAAFDTRPEYVDRYKGGDDDPGYFVVYGDGYQSWSPTKAFEEGYTRI